MSIWEVANGRIGTGDVGTFETALAVAVPRSGLDRCTSGLWEDNITSSDAAAVG